MRVSHISMHDPLHKAYGCRSALLAHEFDCALHAQHLRFDVGACQHMCTGSCVCVERTALQKRLRTRYLQSCMHIYEF